MRATHAFAVHPAGVAPEAVVLFLEAPEAREVAFAVELDIVERESLLAVEVRLVVAAHEKHPDPGAVAGQW